MLKVELAETLLYGYYVTWSFTTTTSSERRTSASSVRQVLGFRRRAEHQPPVRQDHRENETREHI